MTRFGDFTGRGRAAAFVIAALVAASVLGVPLPAQADADHPTACARAVTPAATNPGATVTFSCPNETSSPFESVLVIVPGNKNHAASPAVARDEWLVGIWFGGGLLVLAGCAIAVETSVRRNHRHRTRVSR